MGSATHRVNSNKDVGCSEYQLTHLAVPNLAHHARFFRQTRLPRTERATTWPIARLAIRTAGILILT